MGCETMTQPMRRDSRADAGRNNPSLKYHLDAASRQPAAAKIDNHRTIGLPCNRHRASPCLERIERRLADRHQPILVTLARAHHDHAELVVDIAPVEPDQFAHSEIGLVESLESS